MSWAIGWVKARKMSKLELNDEVIFDSSGEIKMFRAKRGCSWWLGWFNLSWIWDS